MRFRKRKKLTVEQMRYIDDRIHNSSHRTFPINWKYIEKVESYKVAFCHMCFKDLHRNEVYHTEHFWSICKECKEILNKKEELKE